MNHKLYLIVVIILVFSGCSKDTLEQNGEENQLIKDDKNLIKEINSLNSQPWEILGDIFIYENSRLKFSFFEGCGMNQYYEYNNEGLISRIYYSQQLNREEVESGVFDVDDFKNSPNTYVESYIYSNGILTERRTEGYIFYHSYDEENRLKSVEQYDKDFNEYYEKWTINYGNQVIESVERNNLQTGSVTIYTYEFDDKTNPLYVLNSKYGLVDLETCRALDYNSVDSYFFKSNATKVYENDVLRYSATIEYKDDLPTRVSWIDYRFDQSNVELYTYQ